MPDFAAVMNYVAAAFATMGGGAAFVASIKVTRHWGGLEEKFLTVVEVVKVLQADGKKHGEMLAAHDAMLHPQAAPPLPSNVTSIVGAPGFSLDSYTIETLPELYKRWILERFELERLRREDLEGG